MSNVGDIFTAEVESIVEDGRGLVRRDNGQVFFVPGVLEAETVKCRVETLVGRGGTASVAKVLKKSPERVLPSCPHSGFLPSQCGGCSWMHINYSAQLSYKQDFIASALTKFTGGPDVTLREIVASPQVLAYRNRAQLKTNGEKIGFTSYQSKKFAPIDNCCVLSQKNQEIIEKIQKRLPVEKWKPRNKADLNVLHIDESCDALDVDIGNHRPFAQGNAVQNAWMKKWLTAHLKELDPSSSVIELFCGSGNFTEAIINLNFSQVFAFEGDEASIDTLQKNDVRRDGSLNAEAVDLFGSKTLDELLQTYPVFAEAETLILDPPRSGFKFLSQWIQALPKLTTMIYISCKPSTFFRDAQDANNCGFKLKELQPVDQFPHTPHIELLGIFERVQRTNNKKLKSLVHKKPLGRRLRKF